MPHAYLCAAAASFAPDEVLGVLYRRDVIAAYNEAIRTRPTE